MRLPNIEAATSHKTKRNDPNENISDNELMLEIELHWVICTIIIVSQQQPQIGVFRNRPLLQCLNPALTLQYPSHKCGEDGANYTTAAAHHPGILPSAP